MIVSCESSVKLHSFSRQNRGKISRYFTFHEYYDNFFQQLHHCSPVLGVMKIGMHARNYTEILL